MFIKRVYSIIIFKGFYSTTPSSPAYEMVEILKEDFNDGLYSTINEDNIAYQT